MGKIVISYYHTWNTTKIACPSSTKVLLHSEPLAYFVECRVMSEKSSKFEDIVDAYLAYLQVSSSLNYNFIALGF